MGVYQVMTDFLSLPAVDGCDLGEATITTTAPQEKEHASN
jgi:hypothetical protein